MFLIKKFSAIVDKFCNYMYSKKIARKIFFMLGFCLKMREKKQKSAKVLQETAISCQHVQKTQKKRFFGSKVEG